MLDAQIRGFRDNYAWASNFYQAPIVYQRHTFPDNEHAFQWKKTLDGIWGERIIAAETAWDARKLGRQAPIRGDWEIIKKRVMFDLNWAKFTQHPRLQKVLLRTDGVELIEENTWNDTYWGVCNGVGLNYLGRTLMMIRDILKDDRL